MKKGIKRQDSSPGWLLQAKRENESPKFQAPKLLPPKLQSKSEVKRGKRPGLGRRTSSSPAFGLELLLKDATLYLDDKIFEKKPEVQK